MLPINKENHDRLMYESDLLEKLLEGEQDISNDHITDAFESIDRLKQRYGYYIKHSVHADPDGKIKTTRQTGGLL